jgi:hypothetical protein
MVELHLEVFWVGEFCGFWIVEVVSASGFFATYIFLLQTLDD